MNPNPSSMLTLHSLVASAIEAMGLSLPGSSSTPAEDPRKRDECLQVGRAIRHLLELDLKPLDILTRKSIENAVVLTMALGGSTNAVLHLLALAQTARIDWSIDDFQRLSEKVPFIADLRPRLVLVN